MENKYGISYGYEKIDSEFLSNFGYDNKDEILKRLKNKDERIFYRQRNINHEIFEYKDEFIGEGMFLSYADFSFKYILSFIKEDYFFTMVVEYYNPFRKMQKKYPQYFEYQPDDTYTWKDADKVFKMIMDDDKNAPEELVKLYKYFQQIKESIRLQNPLQNCHPFRK